MTSDKLRKSECCSRNLLSFSNNTVGEELSRNILRFIIKLRYITIIRQFLFSMFQLRGMKCEQKKRGSRKKIVKTLVYGKVKFKTARRKR